MLPGQKNAAGRQRQDDIAGRAAPMRLCAKRRVAEVKPLSDFKVQQTLPSLGAQGHDRLGRAGRGLGGCHHPDGVGPTQRLPRGRLDLRGGPSGGGRGRSRCAGSSRSQRTRVRAASATTAATSLGGRSRAHRRARRNQTTTTLAGSGSGTRPVPGAQSRLEAPGLRSLCRRTSSALRSESLPDCAGYLSPTASPS